jgi:hypothetical protein
MHISFDKQANHTSATLSAGGPFAYFGVNIIAIWLSDVPMQIYV